jgi:hypothetical protein
MKCTAGSKSCGQSLVSSPDCPSQVHCLPIVVFLLERHATRNTFSVDPMCILSRPQIHHPRFFPSTHSPGPRRPDPSTGQPGLLSSFASPRGAILSPRSDERLLTVIDAAHKRPVPGTTLQDRTARSAAARLSSCAFHPLIRAEN